MRAYICSNDKHTNSDSHVGSADFFFFFFVSQSLSLFAIFGGSGTVLSAFASKGSGAIEAERERL